MSCTPDNFSAFISDIRRVEKAVAGKKLKPAKSEINAARWAQKSITARINIPTNTILDDSHIIIQRPGTGLPGKDLPKILGRKVRRSIKCGQILKMSDFA